MDRPPPPRSGRARGGPPHGTERDCFGGCGSDEEVASSAAPEPAAGGGGPNAVCRAAIMWLIKTSCSGEKSGAARVSLSSADHRGGLTRGISSVMITLVRRMVLPGSDRSRRYLQSCFDSSCATGYENAFYLSSTPFCVPVFIQLCLAWNRERVALQLRAPLSDE